jgi:hypothetical protein
MALESILIALTTTQYRNEGRIALMGFGGDLTARCQVL